MMQEEEQARTKGAQQLGGSNKKKEEEATSESKLSQQEVGIIRNQEATSVCSLLALASSYWLRLAKLACLTFPSAGLPPAGLPC